MTAPGERGSATAQAGARATALFAAVVGTLVSTPVLRVGDLTEQLLRGVRNL